MKELDIIPREKHETSKNYAKRILVHNILTFRLEPGEQFQDKAIAERIHVSRTPVHEAVLELSNHHIIDIFPNRGTFVSHMNEDLAKDIYEIRFACEPSITARAAEYRSDQDIMELKENLHMQIFFISEDLDRYMKLDDAFHRKIYSISGKEGIFKIINDNSFHFDRMRRLRHRLGKTEEQCLINHREILEKIEERNVEATRQASERHLIQSFDNIIELRELYPRYF